VGADRSVAVFDAPAAARAARPLALKYGVLSILLRAGVSVLCASRSDD
jgi:hypothetical protein